LNVSFVGAEPLADKLGEHGNGVIVTQVVPHIEADLPIVNRFRKAIHLWDPSATPTFGSLEGYIAARIFFQASENIDGPITREAVITALERLGDFDIGLGQSLHLALDDHQACHSVWPIIIRDGKAVPYKWEELQSEFARRRHE